MRPHAPNSRRRWALVRGRKSGRAARAARKRRARALTLFEVIIAISLIVMLMSAMVTFFWQTIEVRDTTSASAERTQLARQVLNRIAAELRGCLGSMELGFPVEQRFAGDRRGVTFLTTALPDEHQYQFFGEFDTLPPAQHDLRLLRYSLWVDPENKTDEGEPIVGGVIRTERRTLNQFRIDEEDPLTERNELFSYELGYLEFRYFDGVEWDTKWTVTSGNSLPQLVQVTVGFKPVTTEELEDTDLQSYPLTEYPFGDDLPHPDRYSMIVRMPAADRFFQSRFENMKTDMLETLGVGGLEGLGGGETP